MTKKVIRAADLFAGAGGASNGLAAACRQRNVRLDLVAVNHWAVAVETHTKNHPGAQHLCEDLESVNPRKVVPGGKLDVLLAGPSCVHHSVARGGKPVNDQSRASAWCILRWATELSIDTILIENVREFQSWGPLGSNNRPLKSRKGETFRAFIDALKSLGYRVDWKVLNAADYGDPTTRERLFIQARRGRRPITWPQPTHSRDGESTLFGARQPWRPARAIIDWSIPGQSIFSRKRPLSPNTLARIAAGLRKFGGKNAEPFLVLLRGTEAGQVRTSAKSLDEPVPTLTAGGTHAGLCQPFIVPTNYGERPGQDPRCHDIDRPMPTVVGSVTHALIEPFICSAGGPKVDARPVSEPMNTVLTRDHMALVEPFMVQAGGPTGKGRQPQSVDEPLGTVMTENHTALVEPFIVSMEHGVKPFVVPTNHGETNGGNQRAYPLDRPMPTVTTVDAWGLIEPFVTKYHGNGTSHPVSGPLPTVDCKDRYALITPDGVALDIRFRMLQPHELAAAMSFPRDYQFAGNREQKVKQIGNAWPGALSEQLCLALIA